MSQPHPTIPGVLVAERVDYDWATGKTITYGYRVLTLNVGSDHEIMVSTNARTQRIFVSASLPAEHAQIVAEMIRDQASWLAEQNGGDQ